MNKSFKKALKFAGGAVNLGLDVARKGPMQAAMDKAVSLMGKPERDRKKRAAKGLPPKRDKSVLAVAERLVTGVAKAVGIVEPKIASRESFGHALSDPFSADARGSRVPDLYSFPTMTYRLQTSVLLGTGSTSFGAVFTPNPFVTMFDTNSMTGVGSPSVSASGGMRPFTGHVATYAFCTPGQLGGFATDFRVVGGGLKIRNLIPELTATGRIYLAVVPVASGGIPNWNILDAYTAIAGSNVYTKMFGRMGVPSPLACSSASLQMLPVSKDFTLGEIVGATELEVNFSIYSPEFFKFKPTVFTAAYDGAINYEVDDAFVNAAGAVNVTASGNKENTQIDGGSAIILWCEGFPGGASPQIEVDVVLHLEATPTISGSGTTTSAGVIPESDNPPRAARGSTAMVENEISRALDRPAALIREVSSIKGSGGASVGKARRGQ